MIYPPQEDSYLLKEQLKQNIKKTDIVLDIGTGSGILALEASKYAKKVMAIDINKKAIKEFAKTLKENKIKNIGLKTSDLFSEIKQKFNIIIFNPPYLPFDEKEDKATRLATTGGKKGYEIIERFIEKADQHLKDKGKILLLFSSLTNKNKVDEIIEKYGFKHKEIAKKRMFFEELYVYLITRTEELERIKKLKINDQNIKNIKKFTKGHRGLIFTGTLKNKKVAVKIQRKDIDAKGTVNREIRLLKKLNKKNIGPRLLNHSSSMFVYDFIEGEFIEQHIRISKKKEIKKILKNIFKQCYTLDTMQINKEEMHHPYKHIIIENKTKKPIMLDFERANYTEKPKNITQFCQYICRLKQLLESKGFRIYKKELRELAKVYKNKSTKNNLNKIIKKIE